MVKVKTGFPAGHALSGWVVHYQTVLCCRQSLRMHQLDSTVKTGFPGYAVSGGRVHYRAIRCHQSLCLCLSSTRQ